MPKIFRHRLLDRCSISMVNQINYKGGGFLCTHKIYLTTKSLYVDTCLSNHALPCPANPVEPHIAVKWEQGKRKRKKSEVLSSRNFKHHTVPNIWAIFFNLLSVLFLVRIKHV